MLYAACKGVVRKMEIEMKMEIKEFGSVLYWPIDLLLASLGVMPVRPHLRFTFVVGWLPSSPARLCLVRSRFASCSFASAHISLLRGSKGL